MSEQSMDGVLTFDPVRPIREFVEPMNLARVRSEWVTRMDALARELRDFGIGFEITVRLGDEAIGYWNEHV